MRITDLLDRRAISLDAAPKTKSEALNAAVGLMAKSGKLTDTEQYRRQVYLREKESTTGIGEGIAIPHGKCAAVKKPGLAAMVIKNGVEFDSLDGEPVTLLFLIAAPEAGANIHLDVLSRLSVMLMDEDFTAALRKASSVDEFLEIIDRADDEKKDMDERFADAGNSAGNDAGNSTGNSAGNDAGNSTGNSAGTADSARAKILAVTSCPTGIAHTYMAAEGLEKAARARKCRIRIETRGSGGAKNVLTDAEIREASCIIVAADAQVPMERFDGKKVIECQVSDGISKAPELIERALCGNVPVYRASSGSRAGAPGAKTGQSAGHKIYTQLMNGVSHMLPLVVGGGILIAVAFLIDGLFVDLNTLAADQRSDFGSITPVAAVFRSIGNTAFGFMLPVLAGFIAMAIGDRPALALGLVGGMMAADGKSGFLGALLAGFLAGYLILGLRKICEGLPEALEKIAPVLIYPVVGVLLMGLAMSFVVEPVMGGINTGLNHALESMGSTSRIVLGLILGGMMAIDMGGPFNKAAYVFGTASIAAGNYDIMAAVMIGGMTPPCAIALASMLFQNKFTEEEREAGPANFIMGLAFITEGAIPFAASDPLRVLPSCIIGSAVAGAISMAAGCTLMAPHGGIFVFPVVGNAWLYLAALAAGTVLSAVLLGILKKKIR